MALMKFHDYILGWIPAGSLCEATCQVQVFRDEYFGFEHYAVLLTELPGNPGRSVTNGVEEIAARLIKDHCFLHTPTFIEHYTRVVGFEETWDLIEWQREALHSPKWRRISWYDIAKRIGAQGQECSEL